ncbi:MAG TPA: arylsulfatase [Sphaerochaeta sp.]|nr:MAG: arylsulfatase [Sphaerochaeta sp.]HOE89056.1 arylsulfatase [Sphaerochaeta sp.]HOR79410.1 arylsulfatase [Sphaerochaeta sp.]HPK63310.1 arylsulfatase [Sphaerochaeta sp.]
MSGVDKPNVVYLLFDDLGYGDVSAFNPKAGFKTPRIDRLAKMGMCFTDAHATSAVCTPSRYSIITGRYNWRSTLKSSVLGGYSKPLIAPARRTIANLFRDIGYRTHAVGKWHLGLDLPTGEGFVEAPGFAQSGPLEHDRPIGGGPTALGFDTFYGISASLDMPPYLYIRNDRFTSAPTRTTRSDGMGYWREGPTGEDFIHEEVLDHLTGETLRIISSGDERPFFLYYALTAPHTPILPDREFRGRSGTNAYGDFVLHCDDVVGRILDAVDENTVVVLTSDNGCSPQADFEELRRFGHHPSHHFRGMKSDIYEGGHRVPYIIVWPGVTRADTVCDRTVSLVDLYATFAEYFGLSLASDEAEDSVSMLNLLEDPDSEAKRTSLIHQSIDGSLSIRKGPWKLELCPGSGGWSPPVPGSAEEKLLPAMQLYNLDEDIGETTNLIDRHPEVVRRMKAELLTIVRDGRSTPGANQPNEGAAFWETAAYLRP